MNKIKYLLTRISRMDKRSMIDKINEIHKRTGISRPYLFFDMIRCGRKYGAGYSDYALFEMYNLTPEQRDTYLTRGRNNEIVLKYCDKSLIKYFENKAEFNTIFNKYLKRDWLKFSTASVEELNNFFKKHQNFIIKPIEGGCGKGVEILKVSDFKSNNDLISYIKGQDTDYVLEELIIQNSKLSKLNPYAINTARIVTIVTTEAGDSFLSVPDTEKDNVKLVTHIIAAFLRIGNNKKHVDNFNSGGMAAAIDEKTGIVKEVALDKAKNLYTNHPITNTPIKGFQLPYWDDAIKMCKETSKKIPRMGYVGWDVAFTQNGVVLVEGNEFPGHDIYQLPEHTPDKIGMMPKFNFKEQINKSINI